MKAFPRAKISVMTLSKFRGPSLTDQGSVSYTFLIKRTRLRLKASEENTGSSTAGIGSTFCRLRCLPLTVSA